MLPDLHTGFSRGKLGDLVFPSLSEFSTVYCDPLLGAALGITDKMEAWPQPPLLILQARSRDEGVRFCDSDLFFLSLVELAGKNVKVLIVLEKNMTKHKAFCSCTQKIICKVTIDICSRICTKNVPG